jgi:NAD(P)-dependent dehydrogenase (short-subunit alcohol dehydrogenase family)
MAIALVTGSSTGIGLATALLLARKGHAVYAAVRNPDTATALHEAIGAGQLPVRVVQLDLTDEASIDAAVQRIADAEQRIDVLVNNAGIGAGAAVEETPLAVARAVFETNYFGTVAVLRAVTPLMRRQRSGRIINVTSAASLLAMGCHGHYRASKLALEGLCEALALEMAEYGVKVSNVQPGVVLTPIWGKGEFDVSNTNYLKSIERLGKFFTYGLGHPTMPEEVAEVVLQAMEAETPHFSYPVGQETLELLELKNRMTQDEWIALHCLQGDAHYDRLAALLGKDYYRS